jgi:ribosome biogenesis GTPase A
VGTDPPTYVLDSPGVMLPTFSSPETGLRFALAGGIPDHMVGQRVLVDYLLFRLNQKGDFA